MANRTVTVRYILDASGYRSGANDISAADAKIASSARASAATANQQQANVERAQRNTTRTYVSEAKARAAAERQAARESAVAARTAAQAERAKVQAARVAAREQASAARQAAAAAKTQALANERAIRAELRRADQAASTARRVAQEESRASAARSRALRQAELGQQRFEIRQAAAVKLQADNERRAAAESRALVQTRATAAQNVGRTAAVTGGVLTAALALSGRAAVQWQADFTGVAKTVDGSTEELSGLETQLRGLARTMPQTHTDIAAVAEAAGQLGIATPNIAQFTKTMLQLGDTTNLSSDEAATSIAQLGNIMGTLKGPPDQVNDNIARIGATIVGLGNNGASTERDITQMGLRIASAGRTIGLNTGQVLGFASAIASTGVEVEAGGTAFSNFALKVDGAVREGGSKLDLLARTSGQTTEQFKQAYEKDAAGALTNFVEGLQNAAQQGQDTNRILKQLGVTGIREADTVRRLALSGTLLRDSLADQAKFYQENNALSREASKRYETEAARIQIATNKVKDDAITIGASILPVIAQVTDGVGKAADKFDQLSPAAQGFAVKSAAVAGGILLVGGGALSAVGSVANLASSLKDLGAGAGTLKNLGAAAGIAAGALIAMQVAGSAVKGIIGVDAKSTTDASQAIAGLGQSADQATPSLDRFFSFSTTGDILGRTDINSLADAFDRLGNQGAIGKASDGVTRFLSTLGFAESGAQIAQERFSQVDQSLSELSQNNAPAAAQAFEKIAAAAREQNVPVERLVELFPQYAKAITNSTAANGAQITSDAQLADLMQGKLVPSLQSAAQGTQAVTEATQKQNTAVTAGIASLTQLASPQRLSAKTAQELAQSMFSTAQATIAASNAQVAYSQATQQAAAQGKKSNAGVGSGTGLGKLNAEQQQNINLLNQQATAFQAVAQNMVVTGKSAGTVANATKVARKQFIDNAVAMGASKKEAANLANSYGLIPKNVKTKIEAEINASAQTELTNFKNLVGDFPPEIRTEIEALVNEGNYQGALNKLKEFQKKRKAEVDVKANKGSAEKDLNNVANKKRRASIEAQAKTGAANSSLASTANRKRVAKVIASAATGAANAALGRTAKSRRSTITATANTGSANAAINAAARPRSTTITVTEIINTKRQAAGKGITVNADGGYIGRASGGMIRGTGGPREDNIAGIDRATGMQTSWVSNREWVVDARTTARNVDNFQRMKDNPGTRWEIKPLATGGQVGIPTYATGGKVSPTSLSAILQYLNVLPDFFAEVKRAASEASKGLKVQRKEQGDVNRARAAQAKARRAVKGAKGKKAQTKAKSNLKKADREVEKQTKELTAAQKKYKDQLTAVTDAQKAAAEQIRNYGDGLTKNYRSSSTSGADLVSLQQQGAADLTNLAKQLDELRKKGLNDSEIARIAARASEGDVAGASALADSILSGGKGLVDQLNKSNKALEKIADALAAGVVTKKTRGMATGGPVRGPGTATSDTAGLFALSNREWVHPVSAVDYYGEAFMEAVRTRTLPRQRVSGYMAQGGQVGTKIVTAPSNASDFIRALEGVSVLVQSPITGEYLTGHIARVADSRIGSALTGAAGGR